MTITRSTTSTAFQRLLTCVEEAPEGMFQDAKDIRDMIGYIADETIRKAQALGLEVCNSDGAFNLEVEIYGYIRDKNEARLMSAEAFGKSMDEADDDLRKRIIAGLERDRAFLAGMNKVPA